MGNVVALRQTPKIGNFPKRTKHSDVRAREYLTEDEVNSLLDAISGGNGRNKLRDRLLILLGYRHGLRASELTGLQWAQVDVKAGTLAVVRLKRGTPATHPLQGDTLRMLRAWRRKQGEGFRWIFTWGGSPITGYGVHKIVAKAGRDAKLAFPIHPHMLRHGCGYYLANKGVPTRTIQLYLGHKNLNHTARYTALAPGAFNGLFQ